MSRIDDIPRDQTSYWARAEALLDQRRQKKWGSFSWITARALLSAINEIFSRLARHLGPELRAQWMAQIEATSGPIATDDLVIDRRDCSSFIIIGDTGEQDASQYVVVPALEDAVSNNPDIGLMVICSDVIYPSGDVNDYVDGYYVPYAGVKGVPIYALPGNHDWYDGLAGFMWHWCGQQKLPSSVYGPRPGNGRELLVRLFWRRPSKRQDKRYLDGRRDEFRSEQRKTLENRQAAGIPGVGKPLQRSPYFAIQTEHVLLVCIDTGIDGVIDTAQGEWLLRMSQRPGSKMLVTGRPLLVNRAWHPGPFAPAAVSDGGQSYGSVGEIVETPAHNYVASIGGDLHNFQHYEREGRPHIVSGGGGAYMSATHTVNEAARAMPDEERQDEALATSPTEAESLSHYGDLMLPRLWRLERAMIAILIGALGAAVALSFTDIASQLVDGLAPGAVVLAALVFVRAVLLPGLGESRIYRAALVLVSLGIGAIAATALRWLSPDYGHRLLWVGLAIVVGLSLSSQALRWTAWWRPAATPERVRQRAGSESDRQPRKRAKLAPARPTAGIEGHWRFWVVGALILLTVVPQLIWYPDWWLIGCSIGAAIVWVYGAAFGRRPKSLEGQQVPRESWRTWGVVLAYGVLAISSGCVLYRSYPDRGLLWSVVADLLAQTVILAVAVAIAFCVVMGVALLGVRAKPTPLAGKEETAPDATLPSYPKSQFALRLGRVGSFAPWLLGVLVGAVMYVQFRWGPYVGWDNSSATARDLPRVILVLLVWAVAIPIVIDTVRRYTGTWYRAVLGIVVAGTVAIVSFKWEWWTTSQFRLVVAVLLVALLALVAAVCTNLVLVGSVGPIWDRQAHHDVDANKGPFLISEAAAQKVLDWRAGHDVTLPERKVVRRADVVSPGTDQPQGPLQKLVAEVFDSDRPPFFKNFLICDTDESAMTVTVAIISGTAKAPPSQAIVVPLR